MLDKLFEEAEKKLLDRGAGYVVDELLRDCYRAIMRDVEAAIKKQALELLNTPAYQKKIKEALDREFSKMVGAVSMEIRTTCY